MDSKSLIQELFEFLSDLNFAHLNEHFKHHDPNTGY